MRSIWAVAANTIKQALRMKVALACLLLLVILLPVMALTTTGDNTLKGRLQTFVSYGLSLTSLLLCLLSVTISVHTVSSDIKHRQIYTIVTKPIRRFQFLLGKVLGVVLLNIGLLVLFSALIYTITVYYPSYIGAGEAELTEATNEFFTARKSLSPPEPDVSKEVAEAFQKLVASGDIDELYAGRTPQEIYWSLTNLRKAARRTADVGRQLLWEFEGVRVRDPNDSIFIKFKYEQVSVAPADAQISSHWLIGDYRAYKYGLQGNPRMLPIPRRDPLKTFREIEIPASLVADDGYLAIVFQNDPVNRTPVMFAAEDGIQVLYKAGSFTANFVRASLVVLFRLVFLACLGVFASTFLSFPVAILVCMVVFFTATVSEFVVESFDFLSLNMAIVYSYTMKFVVGLLPQFDKFGPSKYLVPGELLSWSVLGRAFAYIVCIKAMLCLVLALIVFRYRELARVIV